MYSASPARLVPEASVGQLHGITTHTHLCPVFQKRTCRLCARQGSLVLIETKKSCRIFQIVLDLRVSAYAHCRTPSVIGSRI